MSTGSFVQYESYKAVGDTDLIAVPSHWRELRLKDIAGLERGKFTHRPRNDPQMYDGIHPFIQTGDVAQAKKYITEYKQTLSDKGTEVSKLFKRGTLVMTIAANIGDVAILGFDSYFPDSIVGFDCQKCHVDFLFYLFVATKHELDKVKVTNTQDNLNLERLNFLIKFIPPIEEQQAIADYLDTHTAQIDRKIDLLNQKAQKYAELKQAIINETVTRGLDKSSPLKDSGVDWIGQVPAHWGMKRLKELAFIQNSNVDKKSNHDEQSVLLCNYIHVYNNEIIDSHLEFMPATADISEIRRFRLKKHDVLITKDSESFDEIAVPSLVAETMDNVLCGYHLAQIRVDEKNLYGPFLFRLFQSTKYGFRFLVNAKGITRYGLGQSAINDAMTPIPPVSEQKAIADYLDAKTAHIERIIETIKAEIEKLKELRKTLINDVVTGKIKVYQV